MNEKGLSLIELLVVIAILTLLAAISIPQFTRFLAKAKRAEAMIYLSTLHKSQLGYMAGNDQFFPPNAPEGNWITSLPLQTSLQFGLGPTITKLGWQLKVLVASGPPAGSAQGNRSIGYNVEMVNNFDADAFEDMFWIKSNNLSPCPNGVPILQRDDISNSIYSCP
jgi:prepilin-type N-terminal cleavage/methylation domain-containing protein